MNEHEKMNLVAAVTWWRDYAMNLRAGTIGSDCERPYPTSPYPPLTYGVPMPPPGVLPAALRSLGDTPEKAEDIGGNTVARSKTERSAS